MVWLIRYVRDLTRLYGSDMADFSQLEFKVTQLIEYIGRLQADKRCLEELLSEQTTRAAEFEKQLVSLKNQLDQGGSDRFKLKQLDNERKQLRKLIDQSLSRIVKVEESLSS